VDLILWRHAEAEEGSPDAERRLTAKGVKQARRMAAWLAERLPERIVVLASPARRARETARELAAEFATHDGIGPGGSASALLSRAGWPKRSGTVVVVGHQPILGQAAALALTGQAAEWGIKKGGIIWIVSRDRDAERRTHLYAALSPDLL
jgi:phosphohistidine phosphatase